MDVVSIIVPIYNAEKWLNKCLDSIVNQTYKELEIVLVDDGSTDSSLEICNKYKLKDNRINVISIENNGVANCRNVGLDNAHGDYVLYVDSDDWIEHNIVEILLKDIKDNNVDIALCKYDYCDEKIDKDSSIEILEENTVIEEFIKHRKFQGMLWNKLIKRSLFEGVRFNTDIGYGEDAQLMWKIIKKGINMSVNSKILYHHYVNNEGISNSKFNTVKYDAVKVWSEILNDVRNIYKDKMTIAEAAFADANLITLWEMARAKYKDKPNRKIFVNNLKKYYKSYKEAEWILQNRKLFAGVMVCNYNIAGIILRMLRK